MYLTEQFIQGLSPLEGQRSGGADYCDCCETFVRNRPGFQPNPAWSCSRGAAAVSQLLTCKAGVEEGATPKWCHPIFGVWGVALATLHPPLVP